MMVTYHVDVAVAVNLCYCRIHDQMQRERAWTPHFRNPPAYAIEARREALCHSRQSVPVGYYDFLTAIRHGQFAPYMY